MKQVRVDSVAGKMINADGKWLTCIGNLQVRVGDYIWTDGRCVYGNLVEGGEPLIPNIKEDTGIPLFSIYNVVRQGGESIPFYSPYFELYDYKKIKTSKEVNRDQLISQYSGLINNENKFELIDSASYGDNFCGILDCEISDKGEIYVLESIKKTQSPIENNDYCGGNIFKDGKIVDSYLDKLQNIIDELKVKAIIEGDDVADASVTIFGGFIDKNGNYQVYCRILASCQHMYSTEHQGEDNKLHEGYYSPICQSHNYCVFISNSKIKKIIESGLSYHLSDAFESGIIYNFYNILLADHDIKIPMQDDYYFTFAFPPSMRMINGQDGFDGTDIDYDTFVLCRRASPYTFNEFFPEYDYPSESYEVKIYNKYDKLIATLNYLILPTNIQICKIKDNKFLLFPYDEMIQYRYYGNYGGLFILNGNKNIVELKSQYMAETDYIKNNASEYHMKPLNFRLRPLKNIKKWEKSINKYIKKET